MSQVCNRTKKEETHDHNTDGYNREEDSLFDQNKTADQCRGVRQVYQSCEQLSVEMASNQRTQRCAHDYDRNAHSDELVHLGDYTRLNRLF